VNFTEFETLLLDRIDVLLEDMHQYSNNLKIDELEKVETCISSLFKYHKNYVKSWNVLHNANLKIANTTDTGMKNKMTI
jgi:hypothetical protein